MRIGHAGPGDDRGGGRRRRFTGARRQPERTMTAPQNTQRRSQNVATTSLSYRDALLSGVCQPPSGNAPARVRERRPAETSYLSASEVHRFLFIMTWRQAAGCIYTGPQTGLRQASSGGDRGGLVSRLFDPSCGHFCLPQGDRSLPPSPPPPFRGAPSSGWCCSVPTPARQLAARTSPT